MAQTKDLVNPALLAREEINLAVTFEEALAIAAQKTGLTSDALAFIGSPYTVLKGTDKDKLVDEPLFVRNWRFAMDDETEREYAVMHVVTKREVMPDMGSLFIITDGSTGICAQLRAETEKRVGDSHPTPTQNLLIPNGLTRSDYTIEGDDGKPQDATTFYLG